MDVNGPETKRPRHHYDASQRMPLQPQHQSNVPPHPPPSHPQQGILPGPSPYAPTSQQQQQPPPSQSPFLDVNHDTRNLPDPHSYVQQHPHSGHTTPRDGRFQPDVDFSRRGSASGLPRSPSNEHHQFAPHRPANIVTTGDGQHYPPQYAMDSAGPMSGFPPPDPHMNGNIPTHTIPMHPHDQAAHPMAPAYGDYGQSPVTAGPPSYGGIPYGQPMGQQGVRPPKKGNRATQACDSCRTRKAKCDEGRPRCGFCVETDSPCNYQSVAPAKLDRANAAMIEQLETHSKDIRSLKAEIGSQFARIEELISARSFPHDAENNSDIGRHSPRKPVPRSSQQPVVFPDKTLNESPSSSFPSNPSDSGASEAIPSVAKQNAIHIEHNTAAQKLFRWPAIRALLEKCQPLKFNESTEGYVLNFELKKGPLHLYGRGSGHGESTDTNPPSLNAASPVQSNNSGLSDDVSEGSSPVSTSDLSWGYGLNPFVGDSARDSATGGICSDNTLKLDSKTVNELHQSYMQNMQILHPILDENHLTKMIKNFKKRYSTPSESGSDKAGFAIPVSANVDALRDSVGPFSKPVKRKRSDGQYWAEGGMAQIPPNPKPLLERSPATAIILLVLALGKICEHRQALSGPLPMPNRERDYVNVASYSPALRTDSPPPNSIRHSPSTYPSTASPMGLARQNHLSPGSSTGELPSRHTRNFDVIPGLAYYAQATDILGNLVGSHDISYVQCCLLAGLYAGQLANSVESLTWIQMASRGCCILARDPMTLAQHPKSRQNSIRMAFYTSLQLESDILAEIDFLPSGIRKLEHVQYPDGYTPDDEAPPHQAEELFPKSVVMQYYSYQLHLRQLLDWIQQEVYPPNKALTESAKNKNLRSIFHNWLEKQWRPILSPDINWNNDDHLPRGINNARLRGKYYGAMYIIHRPMIHYALELEAQGELDGYMRALAEQERGSMAPPKTAHNLYLDEVLDSARIAIKAAMRSTTAFDQAMEMKRLIVTNIFGTAHAQFGNLLVLSAVYKSKHLKNFIGNAPKATMEHLFKRTINFLRTLQPISETLGYDRWILECLRHVVFEGEEETPIEPTPSSSFN